jgi:hypothetical protein
VENRFIHISSSFTTLVRIYWLMPESDGMDLIAAHPKNFIDLKFNRFSGVPSRRIGLLSTFWYTQGMRRISNVLGIDDGPFSMAQREGVPIAGAVFAGGRLDGVLMGSVTRDGNDAAAAICRMVETSRFRGHIRLIMLQGIALGGFNVVDAFALNRRLGLPVLVVARRKPDLGGIKQVLLTAIPNGEDKWRIIQRLGPMEPCEGLFIQRLEIAEGMAADVIRRMARHSRIPEPLRTAHLIAGAMACGQSRGNP